MRTQLFIDGACYVRPAVLTGLANGSRIAREEIFGPVLTYSALKTTWMNLT